MTDFTRRGGFVVYLGFDLDLLREDGQGALASVVSGWSHDNIMKAKILAVKRWTEITVPQKFQTRLVEALVEAATHAQRHKDLYSGKQLYQLCLMAIEKQGGLAEVGRIFNRPRPKDDKHLLGQLYRDLDRENTFSSRQPVRARG